jgi:hypothetical protein
MEEIMKKEKHVYTPQTDEELNAIGNELARTLRMKIDEAASPDCSGNIRWITTEGNKTGLGLLRTLKSKLVGLDL